MRNGAACRKPPHPRYHDLFIPTTHAASCGRYPIMSDQPYFEHHVFFCLNQRDPADNRPSCAGCGAKSAQDHAKRRIKELGLNGPGKIRINKSGCLDRCEEGPVLVIYPEGTWYTYVDHDDIDEIIEAHLIGGKIVERLKI